MMKYRNLDTNEIWMLEEIKEAYEQFKQDISNETMFEIKTVEDYINYLLDLGRRKEGGLEEVDEDQ